jgi:hypothetical protein
VAYRALAADTKVPIKKRIQRWQRARWSYKKSLEILSAGSDRGTLQAMYRDEPREIASSVALCNAELAKLRRNAPPHP